jgi:hypothetical protein
MLSLLQTAAIFHIFLRLYAKGCSSLHVLAIDPAASSLYTHVFMQSYTTAMTALLGGGEQATHCYMVISFEVFEELRKQ